MKMLSRKSAFTVSMATASIAAVVMGASVSTSVEAHTRLTERSTLESSAAHGRTQTAVNVPHGCSGNPVIGSVFFMPEMDTANVQTSTDNFETFESPEGENGRTYLGQSNPFIRVVSSKDVFAHTALIKDENSNVLGYWQAGGSLASGFVGQQPIQISAVAIEPESCANNVVLVPSIANICKVTSADEIDGSDSDNPNVDFWTAPDNGTIFDAPAWNYPATFTVERDLENNPLPENCGDGFDVRVYPSTAQTNRDMPVKDENGNQLWPVQ